MVQILLRIVNRRRYARKMAARKIEPIRRDPELDHWVGMWIAVKDGKVIAAAYNSRDLVPKVREMGVRGEGAVAQYVPPRQDSIVIGVG